MIQTKQTTTGASEERLGFEAAIAKGKLYNPLSGKELFEFLIRHIDGMLSVADPPVDDLLITAITTVARQNIERHPALDTEVQGYPKADVKIDIFLSSLAIDDAAPVPGTKTIVKISVTKHPSEEKRGFQTEIELHSYNKPWERPSLHLTSELNLDEIPPDALRILHGLPVPTPARVAGTGPSGEATIVDEPKPATEQQKEAVEKQFGKPKPGKKEPS